MAGQILRLENPPDDPNDDYYLTFCYVCTEQAKSGVQHIRNYGAIVCFSCRAFWRRAHQNPKDSNFNCKTDEQCIINVENRRKCQKCRYNRCIKVGMNPDAVLSGEQKEVRFRKIIQKKKRLMAKQKGKVEAQKSEGQKPRKKCRDKENRCTSQALQIKTETLQLSENIEIITYELEEVIQAEVVDKPLVANVMNLLQPKVKLIASKFNECIKINPNEVNWERLTKDDMCSLMLKLSEEFQNFAKAQSQFRRLTSSDQKILLMKNTPLYIQFWVGLHFIRRLQNLTFGPELEALISIFKRGIDVGQYLKFIQNLEPIAHLETQDQKAVMAYILLFDNNGLITVSQADDLEDIEMLNSILYETLIHNQTFQEKLQDLTGTLESMAVFCAYYLDTDINDEILRRSGPSASTPAYIVMPYTREEESVINKQFKLVDEAFRSIPLGDDIVHEFMMYSLGVPLSKTYMSNVFAVLHERLWKIYNTHPEFESLEYETKLNIINLNSSPCLALIIVKNEVCSNGMEQLQFTFGDMEESRWEELYLQVFDSTNKIHKMSFIDNKLLTPVQTTKFKKLLAECKEFASDQDLFKMNLLLTMFDPKETAQTEPCVLRLYQKYTTLIRRRLEWMATNNTDKSKGQNYHQKTVARMAEVVESLNKLADLLKCIGI